MIKIEKFIKDDLFIYLSMAREDKGWTRNSSLVNALEVVENFSKTPENYLDQIRIVNVFYPEGIRDNPVNNIPKGQVYRIAERLYKNSQKLLNGANLSADEVVVLRTLKDYKNSLKEFKRLRIFSEGYETAKDKKENLEERVCIQLEGCNLDKDSLIVREYEGISGNFNGTNDSLFNY